MQATVLVLGNSGAGKTTLARALATTHALTWLDLDTLVFEPGQVAVERPTDRIRADLGSFATAHARWVIEGSYGDWIAEATAFASVLVFLNPGIEQCLAHHRTRPWEPHKYADPETQEKHRQMLEAWVASYPTRGDRYGLAWHRRTFDAFTGPKIEARDADEAAAFVARQLGG